MNEATEPTALLIHDLGDLSVAHRESAAGKIFQRGWELARSAAEAWLADDQLRGCLAIDQSHMPIVTVGVATAPNTFQRIRDANRTPRLAEVPPDQDAQEFQLEFPGGVRLDILTTREPEGPGAIARYLRKLGEGIQQVELLVHDVDRATEILQTRFRLAPVYPATRTGADGTRVNFFLMASPAGRAKVLIELVEVGSPGGG